MISVVTITFNNCQELKETLKSIEGIPVIESVVINGGSTADTFEFLKSHSGTVVNEKDDGISDAFNKGSKNSRGDAVAYLNSGDVLVDREYYIWADRALRENPEIGFVYSDIVFVDPVAGEMNMSPRGKTRNDLGKGMPFPHPSMVVRREIFDQIGGFSKEYKIAMDFDFAVRLLAAGHRGLYYPHATVRMDGGGVSSSRELQGIMECKKSMQSHGEFSGKNEKDFQSRLFNYQLRSRIRSIFGDRVFKLAKTAKNLLK